MANSDKDILITANRGSATDDPKIEFKGASSSLGPQTITLRAYPLSNGTVSFEGSAGQLFSITNNLTSGSIFSVNDISGIPSIDVDANGTVKLAPFSGNVLIGAQTSTGTASQRLQVTGGAYVSGSVGIGTTTTEGPKIKIFDGNYTSLDITANTESRIFLNTTDNLRNFTLFNSYGNIGFVGYGQGSNYILYHYNGNGTFNTQYTYFQVAGWEVMRLVSSGNVGIGTTSPTAKLHVAGNVKVSATSGNVELYVESGSLADGQLSYIWAAGGSCQAELGVYKHSGITSPSAYMNLENTANVGYLYWTDTSGNFRISSSSAHIGTTSGTVVGTQTSDARLKNVSGPVEYGLNEIKSLNPVRYALKTQPDEEKLGFLAHEVRPLVPEAVFDTKEVIPDEPEDAETKLGMEYVALIPVLVNAVKELAAEIDGLKAQLQTLSTPPS